MTLPQTRREARAAEGRVRPSSSGPLAPATGGTDDGREALVTPATAVATDPADGREASVTPATSAASDAAPGTGSSAVAKGSNALFGRGLLYVVVWSMQLVVSSLISPVLAHLMPPAEFGLLASAIALFQAFVVLSVAGLDQAAVLQRAEDGGDDRRARGLLVVGITTAVVVTGTALVTIPSWADAAGFVGAHPLLLVAVLWVAPAAIVQLSLSLLVAQDRIRVFAVTSLLSSVGGSIIGLGLLVWVSADATTYAWGGVVAQGVAMVIGIAATRPRIAGLFDRRTTARAFRLGIPVALGNLSYFVLNAGDRVVVQRLLGPDEVARYQIAYVVGSAVILLLTFTNQAWAPHFAALRDRAARRRLAVHARDELYAMLAPVLLAVTLVSPVALPVLAPASYRVQDLSVVVFVVALTALPVVASGATGRLLLVERKGVAVGVIAAGAGVLNIGANLVLVPLLGIVGAGLATVVAYTLLAVAQLLVLPDRREWVGPRARVVLPLVGALAVAGASLLLPQDTLWNVVRVVGVVACLPWFLRRLTTARGGAS
ncbi:MULTISPECIES: oligosaccharide flippase family protein [unclassified Curtobacterium]|uniref:lipopolysaccharide biosynthesis protein n=1 Tax=unclassified Curtobacterium TaxID=257496 RepID=UPI0009F48727|nr:MULTISPECIES: oligosaccharide flippase family protein [unclassified Curtobacterium]WIA98945.1 oligosaccharide flippase family protein [Curtobacterium sp. MCBA15_012]